MSHAHRKNSVTVPLGGLNATNQNFAKSLRFNNKSENEKDEWHDQLLAEDRDTEQDILIVGYPLKSNCSNKSELLKIICGYTTSLSFSLCFLRQN